MKTTDDYFYKCLFTRWLRLLILLSQVRKKSSVICSLSANIMTKTELHQALNGHKYWFTALLCSGETVVSHLQLLNRRREPSLRNYSTPHGQKKPAQNVINIVHI